MHRVKKQHFFHCNTMCFDKRVRKMKIGLSLKRNSCPLLLLLTPLVISSTTKTCCRSCNVGLKIVAKHKSQTTNGPPTPLRHLKPMQLNFSAKGCGSGGWFDALHKRAHRKACSCLNAVIRDPKRRVPTQCSTSSSICDFPQRSFEEMVKVNACSEWGLSKTWVMVGVYGTVWGDKGCGGSVSSMSQTVSPDGQDGGSHNFHCD